MSGSVSNDWHLQHVITTLVTCRSIIYHDSSLSDEQMQTLIADIDAGLAFLNSHPRWESKDQLHFEKEHDLSGTSEELRAIVSAEMPHPDDTLQKLHALYRVYHEYLNIQHDKSIGRFVSNFDEAMQTLSTLQSMLEKEPDSVMSQSLERVGMFIGDLFYIFIEFIKALSEVLEAHDVHIDTEELKIAEIRPSKNIKDVYSQDALTQLSHIYAAHQQLNEKYGTLKQRVGASTALLSFLEETISGDVQKHAEIILQLRHASRLLDDLWLLLSNYESTARLLLQYNV
jgi:hypothetical protein